MVSDPGVCPSLAKDGAPRCALKSFCRRIPVSAPLAGVGLLITFLSTFGCLVRAPGLSVSMAEGDTLISVDYEVFGKVQGDMGSIPGRGTKIPHAAGQLSPLAATTEPVHHNYRAHMLWSPHATTREKPAHHNEEPLRCNEDPA
ncbi:acylphosphatase-1 isoform X2 [Physeter macrocephalus]|uniref:Acylphosphatase-1 isoform X2 n=1 Tax=Physeter macrocephalus TaxID=9755 RepID=A0A9W2WZF7_PHYMC|nr:acylphosphatase-1 isoform X2 [Physeter catodon]